MPHSKEWGILIFGVWNPLKPTTGGTLSPRRMESDGEHDFAEVLAAEEKAETVGG